MSEFKTKSFDEWHEDWTGSKVKCENMDVRGAWQHHQAKVEDLQNRVDYLVRQLSIKTRHCEFFEKSRIGHRSLAITRKLQIEKAIKQIEALYTKAEKDYEQDRNPYYDGMLSALDLAEQAIRGELEEQALKGENND